jgi:NTP pyrophosphatase (non-canonical NTP hydrolase)
MDLTDKGLTTQRMFFLVQQENLRQIEKWGVQTHSPFEWLAYTTEELGELSQAISEHYYLRCGSRQDIVKEAIQTATLALKIAEMYSEE